MTFLNSRRVLFAGILFFGLLAMTARSATDPDLWWHLRTGQLMIKLTMSLTPTLFPSRAGAVHGSRMSGFPKSCCTNFGLTPARARSSFVRLSLLLLDFWCSTCDALESRTGQLF